MELKLTEENRDHEFEEEWGGGYGEKTRGKGRKGEVLSLNYNTKNKYF